MKPIAKWNGKGVKEISGLHWWNQTRDRYIVEVRRLEDDNKALLCIFDHKDNDKLIFKKEVSITDREIIKPDPIDFEIWERESEEKIDELEQPKEKK
jgi:hypothetical protein